jgi:hypothetical protein
VPKRKRDLLIVRKRKYDLLIVRKLKYDLVASRERVSIALALYMYTRISEVSWSNLRRDAGYAEVSREFPHYLSHFVEFREY